MWRSESGWLFQKNAACNFLRFGRMLTCFISSPNWGHVWGALSIAVFNVLWDLGWSDFLFVKAFIMVMELPPLPSVVGIKPWTFYILGKYSSTKMYFAIHFINSQSLIYYTHTYTHTYINYFLMCLCECIYHVFRWPRRPEEGIKTPGAELTGYVWVLGTKLGPLGEWKVLLTTSLSLSLCA